MFKLIKNRSKTFLKFKRRMETIAADQITENKPLHSPVMVDEVVEQLDLKNDNLFLDFTFGAGGHSKALLQQIPNLRIVALDRDPIAHEMACELEKQYPGQIFPILGRFSELPELLKGLDIKQKSFDGMLMDLGASSMQFDQGYRGFSISKDGPLDMRMDGFRDPNILTAAHVIAEATETELYYIFKAYGQEPKSRKIAREIVQARYLFKPLKTTGQLGDLIAAVCSKESRTDMLNRKAHVATRVFQALRIFVNNELNELNYGLLLAKRFMKVGGRLAALSFHSLEDIIVKRHIQGHVADNVINPIPLRYFNPHDCFDEKEIKNFMIKDWEMATKHVIKPSRKEVEANPRSRSAKLRVALKLDKT